MPWWMRYLKHEEATDGTGTGESAAGGAVADTGAGAAPLSPGAGEAAGATADVESGMLAAIRSGLAPDAGAAADGSDGSAAGAERVRDPVTGRFVEKPAVQAEAPAAAATPKAGDKAPAAEATKPAAGADPTKPLAPKKADDFALKPEEKASLTPNAQRRVHEIHKEWKTAEAQWETERTTLAQQNEQLQQARESIMGVLTETQTTPEDLTQLLSFNALVKTGNLKGALEMVDAYRAQLCQALGLEAPGVDLLKDFPDLVAAVSGDQPQMTRERALEVANARRLQQNVQQQNQQQSQQQQQVQSIKQQQDDAMAAIERWSQAAAQKDIDWAGKEAKIIEKLDVIVKRYPPNLWLQRLQEEYEATPAAPAQQQQQQQRSAEVPGTGGNTPLRASGARGGLPQAASMEEAIARGLGYTPA